MKNERENRKAFSARWRQCLNPRDILIIFVVAILIAVLLTVLSAGAQSRYLLVRFGANLLFSLAISLSVFVLSVLSGVSELSDGWRKGVFLTLTFAAGGVLGTFVALWILSFFLAIDSHFDGYGDILRFNIVLAIFFGAIINSYFVARDQMHRAVTKLAEKEVHEQKLIALNKSAELAALRARINPHFLFNTLNAIASLIPEQPEKAEKMVTQLASLFRAILETGEQEMIPLQQELATLRDYLQIEKVRLGERLIYDIAMDEALANVPVPALLLQPLVENAVQHGIAASRKGGQISVHCFADDDDCRIEIRDNGPGFQGNSLGTGFGLAVVRDRLKLHYHECHSFELTDRDGVHIAIRIPGENNAQNHSDR